MTDQQRNNAIEAFLCFMKERQRSNNSKAFDERRQIILRADIIDKFSQIYQEFRNINVALMCNYWLCCDIFDAETDQYEICDNAAKAMVEILEPRFLKIDILEGEVENIKESIDYAKRKIKYHEKSIEFNKVRLKSIEDKIKTLKSEVE